MATVGSYGVGVSYERLPLYRRSEPETGAEFAQFFPHFLWVVRDFSLILEDESGSSFSSKTYLERSLTPMAVLPLTPPRTPIGP